MIHWDREVVEEFLDGKQERIGVIITAGEYKRNGKLLFIPCVQSNSGINQANALFILPRSGILWIRLLEWFLTQLLATPEITQELLPT